MSPSCEAIFQDALGQEAVKSEPMIRARNKNETKEAMAKGCLTMREHLEATGNWLFRHRGTLPIIFLAPFLLIALYQSEYFERVWGDTIQTIWEGICITITFLGFAIRCLTVGWIHEGTSGRNTKGQLADQLNTDGMYSLMRHPLYVGNFFIILGFSLFVQVWWFVVITLLLFVIFYERIIFAEEEFLAHKFGDAYLHWARRRGVFFPNLRSWKKPTRPISYRMILKREYSTFFGIIVTFLGLKMAAEFFAEQELEFRSIWLLPLFIGLAVYGGLGFLRKKTNFLKTTLTKKAKR